MIRETQAAPDARRARVALAAAVAAAALLVVARSLLFVVHGDSYFDSDQAIVGLMAKHLAEGRAIPLFFYGQSYMLAIESWIAAPLFLVAPVTTQTLKASLTITNIVAAALFVIAFVRSGGLPPALALVAAVFFVFPPPLGAGQLVGAAGGTLEPFLFVSLLWMVRRRPGWFGILLALGFLQREFTIYVVPPLIAGALWRRTLFTRRAVRHGAIVLVAFLATWEGTLALKAYADLDGPGTRGEFVRGIGGSQVDNLAERIRVVPADFPERAEAMLAGPVAQLLGTARDTSDIPHGHDWLGWLMGLACLAAAGRIGMLLLARYRESTLAEGAGNAYAWYLLGVGAIAAAAFVITRPVAAGYIRYVVLVLLLPMGVTGVALSLEPRRAVRALIVAVVCAWTAASAVDHVRFARSFVPEQGPDDLRQVAAALQARGISVTRATYWRAYKLTFLVQERVKVASSDYTRIREYQRLANARGPDLVEIRERPCEGGERVGPFYLCRVGP